MLETTAAGGAKSSQAGRSVAAKPCDFCKSAPAVLFCRKDTAFFCTACDTKLHGQTKHERVWMCEVCEQAPASVTCKADAAVMCVTCDRDIHSANPLARRHVRIPVVPFYNSGEFVNLTDTVSGYRSKEDDDNRQISRNMTNIDHPQSVDLSSADDFLFNFGFRINDSVNDAVVPVQSPAELVSDHRSTGNRYEINFNRCVSNNTCNKRNSQSHNVSSPSSSMENTVLDVSKVKRFSAKDREARVLRYREKRKRRKFEKKIRYASRKAYAEMRPRIKGRFAKRTEMATVFDRDRWWFSAESSGNGCGAAGVEYGVVPSF
ncbi:putative transcription factor C2C2-CO-like family [Helianthus annuus]|uniref:Putative B-box-type zinc finger, CCT domain protein n=1 Tax=Helianthus annuus TaxID=4232 RepID=A0A251UN13_HELAN|nr:zinc finger protein CONSTANS-LIKE 3 [Helianthus annuus]KAF5802676.1 putative transcription factor C2C2-CO-like family [Helianthus annuus]KAJ0567196.1 putative transcription factor C2C2-CO-like family [Helianthus annuus]KAJ0573810.1 putative transcription factor C2C2-CO-like family [Helianthus annuus]KAJ0634500.1 putative transcription factor C2C2-CO-like family [Helianthus annuus]KAJ0738145.1 putative transcription factor C2C2-CO-like family [Helianthus annuus]